MHTRFSWSPWLLRERGWHVPPEEEPAVSAGPLVVGGIAFGRAAVVTRPTHPFAGACNHNVWLAGALELLGRDDGHDLHAERLAKSRVAAVHFERGPTIGSAKAFVLCVRERLVVPDEAHGMPQH